MATAEPDYYCHRCQIHIGHVSDNQCPHCQDSFIEEVEPQMSFSSAPLRYRLSGRIPLRSSNHHGNATIVLNRNGNNTQFQQHNDIEPFFQNILAQLFSTGQQLPFMTNNGRGGGAETMFSAGNLDTFLTQLLNQVGENSGPAPASENRITSIPTVEITSEQAHDNLQCTICMEEFREQEKVKRLPCSHHFHEQCISTWLRLHGTCPTCRVTLEGDNTTNREYFNIYPNPNQSSSRHDRGNNGSSSNLYEFD